MKQFLVNLFAPPTPAGSVWACEKPTTTLCKMIAATMLADLPAIKYGLLRGNIVHEKFDLYFRHEYVSEDSSRKVWRLHSINRPEGLDLDEREKTILVEAFKKLQKLREAKEKADAETRNQERAVNALADWMGVGEQVKETDSAKISSSGATPTAC